MKTKLIVLLIGLLIVGTVTAGVTLSRMDSDLVLDKDIKRTLEDHKIIDPTFKVDKGDNYWLVSIVSEGLNSPNNQIRTWHKVCIDETDLSQNNITEIICNEWERGDYTDEEMELKVDKFIDAKLKRVGEGLKARDDKAGLEPYAEGTKTLKSKSLIKGLLG